LNPVKRNYGNDYDQKDRKCFFLGSLLWVNAQEKTTDIENIEFQGNLSLHLIKVPTRISV
jgi:iron complex outermembrane receptor protein